MITTIDGVVKNVGDISYMISYHFAGNGNYYCIPVEIDDLDFIDENQNMYYDSEELCKNQARLMNQDNKI